MATALIPQQTRRAAGGKAGMRIFRQGQDLLCLMAVPGARDTDVIAEITRGALVVRTQPCGGHRSGRPADEPRFFRRLNLPFTPRPRDVTAWIFNGVLLVRVAMPRLRDWEHYGIERHRPAQRGRHPARVAAHLATS